MARSGCSSLSSLYCPCRRRQGHRQGHAPTRCAAGYFAGRKGWGAVKAPADRHSGGRAPKVLQKSDAMDATVIRMSNVQPVLRLSWLRRAGRECPTDEVRCAAVGRSRNTMIAYTPLVAHPWTLDIPCWTLDIQRLVLSPSQYYRITRSTYRRSHPRSSFRPSAG